MSTGYILLWAFIIFYCSIGIGTAIKHRGKIRALNIPYYVFLMPAKALVKTFALLSFIANMVGYAHIATKERGKRFAKEECERLTFSIGYDYFQ